MRRFFFVLFQFTWGLPQNLAGLALYVLNRRAAHFPYHGTVVTVWKRRDSASLGMFLFLAGDVPRDRMHASFSYEERQRRLLVHEFGHTIQSLILGPFYLFIIGIPSFIWAHSETLRKKRRREDRSYFDFYTENWANRLGERFSGERSMGLARID